MSKRNTYRPSEIRAGKTIHIVTRSFSRLKGLSDYGVVSYLVAGKHEPQPEPNAVHPYRMHPDIAQYAGTCTDLWKSRRAAQAEANRRQAIEAVQYKRGQA